MRISQAIAQLEAIREKFGDIAITGGSMSDDRPLGSISVTDRNGMKIWPHAARVTTDAGEIDGVFLE